MTDNRIAAILSDNAEGAHITPATEKDYQSAMVESASAFAIAVHGAADIIHNATESTAKAWGSAYFNLVRNHNHEGDALVKASRVAMGWENLAGEAGRAVRQRFNTLTSVIRTLNGDWLDLTPEEQNGLMAGTTSPNTVKAALAKRIKAAKKAVEDAKAAQELADNPPVPATVETVTVETVEMDASELILALTVMLDTMDGDAIAAIQEDFAAMVNAYDGKVNAILDAQAQAA
jgi:hypothetical protein